MYKVCYWKLLRAEAATRDVLCQKLFLEISQDSQETRQSFFFNKEILWQVFSCGFCEISKNTFLTEQLWTTASMRALNSFYIFRSDDRIYILLQYDCFPNLWENVFIIFVRKM